MTITEPATEQAQQSPSTSEQLRAGVAALVAGVDELAAWCDRHPDVRIVTAVTGPMVYAFASNADEFAAWARALADGAPIGAVKKSVSGSYANVDRRFGPLTVQVTAVRDLVCEQVQVGTRVQKAHEPVAAAAALADVPIIEVEVPVMEWVCPDTFTVPPTAETGAA